MRKNLDPVKRIIVALDVDTADQALAIVDRLPEAEIFKIGLKLFTAEGPAVLEAVRKRDKRVFLDLKLHDIPNTVAGAVKTAARHGVAMMTLHASGGSEMLARAAEAAEEEAEKSSLERPLLLAVTVLTSLKDAQLKEIGFHSGAADQVQRMAALADASGIDGVVCSPLEIELIRNSHDFLIVTPGIRPAWAAAQDQKRIMTPAKALKNGSDYLVIGRPIIADPSPHDAFQKIKQEILTESSGTV